LHTKKGVDDKSIYPFSFLYSANIIHCMKRSTEDHTLHLLESSIVFR